MLDKILGHPPRMPPKFTHPRKLSGSLPSIASACKVMESIVKQSLVEGKNVERYMTKSQCLQLYNGDEDRRGEGEGGKQCQKSRE